MPSFSFLEWCDGTPWKLRQWRFRFTYSFLPSLLFLIKSGYYIVVHTLENGSAAFPIHLVLFSLYWYRKWCQWHSHFSFCIHWLQYHQKMGHQSCSNTMLNNIHVSFLKLFWTRLNCFNPAMWFGPVLGKHLWQLSRLVWKHKNINTTYLYWKESK